MFIKSKEIKLEFVDTSTVDLYKTDATDLDVARAAWVSQDAEAHRKEKEPGRVAGLINFLVREGHTSTLEHNHFTFIVKTPIFVSRQIVRHRTLSVNEISGRYSTLPPQAYVPPPDRPTVQTGKVGAYEFSTSAEQYAIARYEIERSTLAAYAAYERMLENGVAKEVARSVLPTNMMTSLMLSANMNNWFKFLNLRLADDAQWEIRQVAAQIEDSIRQTVPVTYAAYIKNK